MDRHVLYYFYVVIWDMINDHIEFQPALKAYLNPLNIWGFLVTDSTLILNYLCNISCFFFSFQFRVLDQEYFKFVINLWSLNRESLCWCIDVAGYLFDLSVGFAKDYLSVIEWYSNFPCWSFLGWEIHRNNWG